VNEIEASLHRQFGGIDIYLFDQLARGRLAPGARVLDAGCGAGRNLVYLLRQGLEVFAADRDPHRIAAVRALATDLAPQLPAENFRHEPVEDLTFPDRAFDFVISSAVLHFSPDIATFDAKLGEMWRVLAPGGVLFARLASTIGIEGFVTPRSGQRFGLPDGSERFLVDEAMLLERTEVLGARLLDPIKTTNVQNLRAMTTWVIARPEPGEPT